MSVCADLTHDDLALSLGTSCTLFVVQTTGAIVLDTSILNIIMVNVNVM